MFVCIGERKDVCIGERKERKRKEGKKVKNYLN